MPEWPPSPLRLFQAMVAGGVGRSPDASARERTAAALRWLESFPSPEIYVPDVERNPDGSRRISVHRSYVPDNIGDKVARSWSSGREASLADYRTEKDVRALSLGGDLVCFRYLVGPDVEMHLSAIVAAMRSITHLGWGVDLVIGDARLTSGAERPAGERWTASAFGECSLRCPTAGTLEALQQRHGAFLSRLAQDVFVPVPPLGAFLRRRYGRAAVAPERPFACFRLTQPVTGDRCSFDPVRRARDVAAWLRHRVGELSATWPFGAAVSLVHGHGDKQETGSRARISYVPMPTIVPGGGGRAARVGDLARVMLTAPPEHGAEILWLQEVLNGEELDWEQRPVAALDVLPDDDWVLRRYLPRDGATTWTTVTPVVLPGHHDRSERKTERLVRKALVHTGLAAEAVAEIVSIDWGTSGFLPGLRDARAYLAPDKVSGPQLHVRIQFRRPIKGPLTAGSGRHRGVGTFVALNGLEPVPSARGRGHVVRA